MIIDLSFIFLVYPHSNMGKYHVVVFLHDHIRLLLPDSAYRRKFCWIEYKCLSKFLFLEWMPFLALSCSVSWFYVEIVSWDEITNLLTFNQLFFYRIQHWKFPTIVDEVRREELESLSRLNQHHHLEEYVLSII